MRIAVYGAGAWGTALAATAAARHEVMLWARDPAQAARLRDERCNVRYLSRITLPPALQISADHAEAVAFAAGGLHVIGTPMGALRERLAALPERADVVWLCKGFEAGTGALGPEIAAEIRPAARVGVLSGPSFAKEVARGLPTALVVASTHAGLDELAVQAFHGDNLRIYTSDDPIGVAVGGAVKNVLAIATGACDGLGLGLNARAALITRGLAEMTRLGIALGAQEATFMGLSGIGDLVLTATGELSRNRRVGMLLASGKALPEILGALGHVAEGVYSAPTVRARAQRLGVEMPICESVVEVLEGRLTPEQALRALMARGSRAEH